ncbi:serine/threonine-protein phosphatase bsl2 [Phtheirospermum japonicum]|uniref:Serine/threonine-protein phosphatase bsl2 n=1 Tax=Phtheirospermum japonicum TaxID=374723 RepID=A0A830C6D5_9LAMI|nr:serine/threonine-protein phosphatase bsl2 [Phtheirospermum japonicum]
MVRRTSKLKGLINEIDKVYRRLVRVKTKNYPQERKIIGQVITGYLSSLILEAYLSAIPPMMIVLSSIQGYIVLSQDQHFTGLMSFSSRNESPKVTPIGEPPTPRAAHVATAVDGIGPAGLSAENLHVLDLTQQRPRWHTVVVQGPGPGPRYGHVMALVGQWYATARSDGLILLCGGRDANSVVLLDKVQKEVGSFDICSCQLYHKEIKFAPHGLINMCNSKGATNAVEIIGDSSCNEMQIEGRGEGIFGAYSSLEPGVCYVSSKEVNLRR